jgi:Glyoxalase-like domain
MIHWLPPTCPTSPWIVPTPTPCHVGGKPFSTSEDPDDPNEPGHEECLIYSRDGPHRMLFIEVPEKEQVKNRINPDLRPVEGTRDAELARLTERGAAIVADRRNADGMGWVVLADPEGNEFCVLRSDAETIGGRP